MNAISIRPLLLGSVLVAALVTGAAAKPIAIFECQERLGFDWPRTLVTYPVAFPKGGVNTNELRLVDINGNEQLFQLSRLERNGKGELTAGRISFFASLPATTRSDGFFRSSQYRYELFAEKPLSKPTQPFLQAVLQGKMLLLGNQRVSIRLLPPGEVKFDAPQPLHRLPGPICNIVLLNELFIGGSWFGAADTNRQPRVTGYTCELTEEGPLFLEARVRYFFADDGKPFGVPPSGGIRAAPPEGGTPNANTQPRSPMYEMTVRVLADDPAIRIDEQYDFSAPGPGTACELVVALSGSGWKPDAAYGLSVGGLAGESPALAARLTEIGLTNQVGMSLALTYDKPSARMFGLVMRHPWSADLQYFGLVDTKLLTADAVKAQRVTFLGVAPMHPGNWRGSVNAPDGTVYTTDQGHVELHWPLNVPAHPRSVLHTGEYDPEMPFTTGRRQWAIIGGSWQNSQQLLEFRRTEGYLTLDDFKDWVLDWPVDPKITYPRLLNSKNELPARPPVRMDPVGSTNAAPPYLYERDDRARCHALWGNIEYPSENTGPWGMLDNLRHRDEFGKGTGWLTTYRFAQMAHWVHNADELFSSQHLSADQRSLLRAQIAAVAEALAEPDVNPRGAMVHLGNPSMPINRFLALPWLAAVIPDHPQARHWLDVAEQYVRYKLAMNVAPGGAWSELITYYQAGVPHFTQTAEVLARTGRFDKNVARVETEVALFPTRLLSPRDPRFGKRTTPAWGHEGADALYHYLAAAALARRFDPEAAKALIWSWDQTGRATSGAHDCGFSPRLLHHAELLDQLKPGYVPAELASSWLPGFGATMRAHVGDPNETYLSLRNGYHVSHSDDNQGDFVLYSKGAPLVTLSVHAYAISQGGPFDKELHDAFGWHNRPRFGNQDNPGGWPGGGTYYGIPAHAFSDSCDYLRAPGDYGSNRWTRQVAFLKGKAAAGPNYFVFRDSFDSLNGEPAGKEKKWWYLRTLGLKDQVQTTANEIIRTSAFGGTKLTAHFLQPASIQTESRDGTQDGNLYYDVARLWFEAGSPVRGTNFPSHVNVSDQMTVTAVGPLPPEQDVLVVLYPQGKTEAAPQYELLGDGAAKITTSEGTDYVFLDRKPMQFESGDVSFEGLAGAVRVYPKEIHLIISEGPGRVTYRGATLSSTQPAVKIIRPGQKGNFEIAAHKTKLKNTTLPEGCRIAGDGECELTIEKDRIIGKSDSRGAFLYTPMPPDLKVLPDLVIDGKTYAPGIAGNSLVIPLMPGEHSFEVRGIEQPPIFRNWEAW